MKDGIADDGVEFVLLDVEEEVDSFRVTTVREEVAEDCCFGAAS